MAEQDNQQNTSVEENIDEENLALHPLENEWSFWYDRRQNNNKRTRGEKDQYESNLIHVGAFATVSIPSRQLFYVFFLIFNFILLHNNFMEPWIRTSIHLLLYSYIYFELRTLTMIISY